MAETLAKAAPIESPAALAAALAPLGIPPEGGTAAETAAGIEADRAEARRFGAVRSPTLFINGRYVGDAGQDTAALETRVMEAAAESRLDYEAVLRDGLTSSAMITGPGFPGADSRRYAVGTLDGPSRGPDSAPVTITVFGSFTADRLKSLMGDLEALVDEGGVRVVWRNYPQPGDAEAQLAAQAMVAATLAGKPWPMHAWLMAQARGVTLDGVVAFARTIGLDAEKLRAELSTATHAPAVEREFDGGMKIAGTPLGSPTVFVGHRMIMGVHPLAVYREALEAVRALAPHRAP